MPQDWSEALAERLKIRRDRVTSALALLDAGLRPAFLAHYRQAETGGLDAETLCRLRDERDALARLADLRAKARAIAQAQGALTDDLAAALEAADTAETIEDIVRPHRPRRRTAGQVARERGLEPLAEYIRHAPPDGPDLMTKAAEFVDPAREVRSPDEAVTGAAHILAERVADAAAVRQAVRDFVWKRGVLVSRQAGPHARRNPEFRAYLDFSEPLRRIPPHRVLAINRGQRSRILRVTVTVPFEDLLGHILAMAGGTKHRFAAYLRQVVADALRRLILPTIDREIRRQLTERAESHAIDVFVANLRSLLMTRPVPGRRVLAIQPGYRTGCKTAVLDPDGRLLAETILYPLEPQKQWDEAKAALADLMARHGVETIAIGNGTGCREVEALVSETLDDHRLDARYAVVSEAGAAAYADSPSAREEFGHLDPAVRAAVSIGRRLQDPLAEFVKIDPRAIGVGLYQHDVDQGRLERALDDTLEACVAAVGVAVAAASPEMLRRVPGLSAAHVEALLARRAEAPPQSRDDLRALPGWDDAAFLQAAGFLRIRGPNPLDATRIHPERYADAERLLAHLGRRPADLASPEALPGLRDALTDLPLEPLARELDMDLAVLQDLVAALLHPDDDPRAKHHGPILRKRMRRIEDLQPGQWVKGTVRNVVDFGAFVDVGLKEEGLIHISEFSNRYVRNPMRFLHVGDVVNARVVKVDAEKHRISLSLVPEKGAPRPRRGRGRPGPRDAGKTGAPAEGKPRAAARGEGQSSRAEGEAARTGRPERRGGDTRGRSGRRDDRGRGGSRSGREGGRGGYGRGRDRRPRRSGPPRVIVSKADTPTGERDPDRLGRPKIRWAYYDSDSPEDHVGTEYIDEWEEIESAETESDAPAIEPVARGEPRQESNDAPETESPEPEAAEPETPEAPEVRPEAPDAERESAEAPEPETPETPGPETPEAPDDESPQDETKPPETPA